MTRRYTRFMFGISMSHLVILAVVLLLVGPRRLPEVGYKLGKAFKNFKDALSGIEEAKFRNLDSQAYSKAETESTSAPPLKTQEDSAKVSSEETGHADG